MGRYGTGRKAKPVMALDNSISKKTKAELGTRDEQTPSGCEEELKPPKKLSKFALAEWKRIIGLYKQLNLKIMNDLDIAALSMYCEAYAIWRTAQDEWSKIGKVTEVSPRGKVTDPNVKVMNEQTVVMTRLSEQLCLTPVGRARYGIEATKKPKEGAAEMDKFI
jgi:P27 family predicted phage terminase small subunit